METESKTVTIHGNEWKKEDVQQEVAYCRTLNWEKAVWKPTPALVHKAGGRISQYVGQKYDPTYIELVQEGWTHDHCQICWWELYESDDPKHGIGYKSGNSWVCQECYEKFIENNLHE